MRIFSNWMLYEANSSGLRMIGSTVWDAHFRSASTIFARSKSLARMASIIAMAGCGPIEAAVAQQAVVVSGESSAKRNTAPSLGRKWTRPLLASRQASRVLAFENLADMTVGAWATTRPQNSGE